jgi:predicted TIM-barrel fold metal-dependent hydrolase
MGIDFALLYPTFGLHALNCPDDQLRKALVRAMNRYYAEVFADYRDRLEPVAVVPTHHPQEAVDELDFAVGTLGLKAVVMSAVIPRQVRPDGQPQSWIDTLGYGSLYDYDPVWAKCQELHVAPAFHGIGYGWGTRNSPDNYVFNHLGSFGAAQEAACRSMFMGGIPARFPTLRFAFLEGGVAWACQLLADLLGHFEKRNRRAVQRLNPATMDVERCAALFAQFARGRSAAMLDRFVEGENRAKHAEPLDADAVDDFLESGMLSNQDIVDVFSKRFFFGCEADDPLNALAFDDRVLPPGSRLNAMFASDIGHWDVTELSSVLLEAWELVEQGRMSELQFGRFVGGNAITMLTACNPKFFAGSQVSGAVTATA